MNKHQQKEMRQLSVICIILVLMAASLSIKYRPNSNEGNNKEPSFFETFRYSAEPFLNPINETTNRGGWDGHLYDECFEGKCPDKKILINDSTFTNRLYEKFYGGRPAAFIYVSIQKINLPVYIYSTNESPLRFLDNGKVRPIENSTIIQGGISQLHTIENAMLAYIDSDRDGQVSRYDKLIFFRDWNSDGSIEFNSYDYGTTIIEKDGIGIAYGYFRWYNKNSAYRDSYFQFKTNTFENRSYLDNRSIEGWYSVLVWLNHSIDNVLINGQTIDLTPPLSKVKPYISGISFNGYEHLFLNSITEANVLCNGVLFDLYVFAYPNLDEMTFKDNGPVVPLTNETACRLDRSEVVTVTGAAFIFLDNDQDGNLSVNDSFYAFRPIDRNGHEYLDIYSVALIEPQISISLIG